MYQRNFVSITSIQRKYSNEIRHCYAYLWNSNILWKEGGVITRNLLPCITNLLLLVTYLVLLSQSKGRKPMNLIDNKHDTCAKRCCTFQTYPGTSLSRVNLRLLFCDRKLPFTVVIDTKVRSLFPQYILHAILLYRAMFLYWRHICTLLTMTFHHWHQR